MFTPSSLAKALFTCHFRRWLSPASRFTLGFPSGKSFVALVATLLMASPGVAGTAILTGARLFVTQLDLPVAGNPVLANERFGSAFATGDFNNDGYDDLAVGEPFATAGGVGGSGQVHVFYSNGPDLSFSPATTLDGGVEGSGSWFGFALDSGDYNDDGVADLAVGAPLTTVFGFTSAGAVWVYYGKGTAFSVEDQIVSDWEPVQDALLGFSLTSRKFLDGLPDVLYTGAPGSDVADGGVMVEAAGTVPVWQYSAISQRLENTFDYSELYFQSTSEAGDGFGYALTTGDFNGDGSEDLAIGGPFEDVGSAVDAGAVFVHFGLFPGPEFDEPFAFTQLELPSAVPETGDLLGFTLAAADLDNDGYADLVAGVPSEDVGTLVDAGAVHVIRGNADGLDVAAGEVLFQSDSGLAINEAGDQFGLGLATGDFTGDNIPDLLAGAFKETVESAMNTGAVILFRGHSGPLNASGAELFFQGNLGIAGQSSEAGDEFGAAFGIGDFDGNGSHDVVIGVSGRDAPEADSGGFYVLFDGGLFRDGFESGDLSAWQ